MAVQTPNALLPLAVNTARPVSAFQASERQGIQNRATEAGITESGRRVQAFDAAETERQDQAETIERFRNVESGVKKLSPLLDQVIAGQDPTQFMAGLEERRTQLIADGRPTEDTDLAIQTAQGGNFAGVRQLFDQVLENGRQLDAAGLGIEAAPLDGGSSETAETRTSAARAAAGNFTEKEIRNQALVEGGLKARAGSSAIERIATIPGLTELIAASQSDIKQATKFAEMTGASRAKTIDSSFDSIQGINKNIRNMDKAIAAIDEGASTGAIESQFFPTIRESTVKLEQVQKELGLDIIGSVTFGALSEGELDLALRTALPTKLEPAALREFLVGKKEAQEKLRGYYESQIDFLDQGGTVAGFLREQGREQPEQDNQALEQQAQEAIAAGADPAAVNQRLNEMSPQ